MFDIRPDTRLRLFFRHLAVNVGPSGWVLIVYFASVSLYYFERLNFHFLQPVIVFMQGAYSFGPVRDSFQIVPCAPVVGSAIHCPSLEISIWDTLNVYPWSPLISTLSALQPEFEMKRIFFQLGLLPLRFWPWFPTFSLARIRPRFEAIYAEIKSMLSPAISLESS